MMDWSDVGGWLKANAGSGAALVGSLLTGNVPAAVALGVKLVAGATGHAEADQALQALQADPQTVIRLKELAVQQEAAISAHIERMAELQMADQQAEHHETQETIRAGDKAEDRLVRWTRPLQSWLSLAGAIWYALRPDPTLDVLIALLTLPAAYAGLRTFQHWKETDADIKKAVAK